MAYTPIDWQDHIMSDNHFNIKENGDGTVSLTPAGKVIQQGTPMSADNFNHMEEGIKNASEMSDNAIKLKTARKINGILFDGTKDISVPGKRCMAYSTSAADCWVKAASVTYKDSYKDHHAAFLVQGLHSNSTRNGILHVRLRVENTNGVLNPSSTTLRWSYATSDLSLEDFVLVYTDSNEGTGTAELWCNAGGQYKGYVFTLLEEYYTLGLQNNAWTLYNLGTPASAYTEGTRSIVSDMLPLKSNQQLLSSTADLNSPYTTVSVSGMFTKYSSAIFNISTSGGGYSITVPLKYVKSLGTSADYQVPVNEASGKYISFKYVDNSNIYITSNLNSAAIQKIEIISLC